MDYQTYLEEAKRQGKKQYRVYHLLENNELDLENVIYEFYAHNPIKFIKKSILTYRNIFEFGYAFCLVGSEKYTKIGGVQK